MLTTFEPPQQFNELRERMRLLCSRMRELATPSKLDVRLSAAPDVLLQLEAAGGPSLCFLKEGLVNVTCNSHVVLQYEEGDIFGIERQVLPGQFGYSSEFGLRVDVYNIHGIAASLTNSEIANTWIDIQSVTATALHMLLASRVEGEKEFVPKLIRFAAGDEIIREGTAGEEVMTLLEGEATVFVNRVNVGRILPDEIFGALAALTSIPRTASVIASKSCLVYSVSKDQFLELMKFRPRLVLKMIQDLGRALVDSNSIIVKSGRKILPPL